MFSSGQWTFVIFFIIAFVITLFFSYRKDKALHKKYYKGSISSILIGNYKKKSVPTSIKVSTEGTLNPSQYAGLIGVKILKDFDIVIDNKDSKLYLKSLN